MSPLLAYALGIITSPVAFAIILITSTRIARAARNRLPKITAPDDIEIPAGIIRFTTDIDPIQHARIVETFTGLTEGHPIGPVVFIPEHNTRAWLDRTRTQSEVLDTEARPAFK
jgi:hypothetical protein